jgi:DNA-binding CsgD family transcriptional regulator
MSSNIWLPRGDSSGRIASGFVIDLGKARERLRGGDPAVSRTPRLMASLALAQEIVARLSAGGVSRAALAREYGITRARVTQLLALLSLPDEVLGWIREQGAREPQLSERRLRPLLRESKAQQLRAMAALFASFRTFRAALA